MSVIIRKLRLIGSMVIGPKIAGLTPTATPLPATATPVPATATPLPATATPTPTPTGGIVTSGLMVNLATAPSSGTVWTDATGNGYSATLQGTPTYTGSFGGGIKLNKVARQATERSFYQGWPDAACKLSHHCIDRATVPLLTGLLVSMCL